MWETIRKIHAFCVIKLFLIFNRKWYQPCPWIGRFDRKKRHEPRFQAIIKEIKPKASVLDIGCNIGFYTINLALAGHYVTAVDNWKHVQFLNIVKTQIGADNIAISDCLISPKNVSLLPNYDVILCMSLVQHWCREYGRNEAFNMLNILLKKCKVMFFDITECPRDSKKWLDKYKGILPDMGKVPIVWLHSYFKNRGYNVKTLGYWRGRHLLKIYR